MAYLLDTNILLRLVQRADPQHTTVRAALRSLRQRGEILCITPQNIVEFWNVCTRPATSRGGYGLSAQETAWRVRLLEKIFIVLPDRPSIHDEWKRLVEQHQVRGVQVHDARIAAAMLVHGVTHILTFNSSDFTRYSLHAEHPANISASTQASTN